MRVHSEEADFIEWLLKVGNGEKQNRNFYRET